MSQFNDTGIKTFVASEAIPRGARVKLASGKVAKAGITDKDIGTTLKEVFADGDDVPVKLRSAPGTHKAIAAAAIAEGAEIFTAAAGKVSVSAATSFRMGHALEAATADGDLIEVVYGAHGDTAV